MIVSIVIFPDFELLDVFGPAEMFGMARDHFTVELVASEVGPVASSQGPSAIAERSLSEIGEPDILLVPGGFGTRTLVYNDGFLVEIARMAESAQFVTSVCTGSALLAKAGVLDGKRATSNKNALDWVMAQGPQVEWDRGARWVEDGRYWTSSGVSAGMDMSLALIEKIEGPDLARSVATFAEYDRKPIDWQSTNDRSLSGLTQSGDTE